MKSTRWCRWFDGCLHGDKTGGGQRWPPLSPRVQCAGGDQADHALAADTKLSRHCPSFRSAILIAWIFAIRSGSVISAFGQARPAFASDENPKIDLLVWLVRTLL
jgi:hypothetical protein